MNIFQVYPSIWTNYSNLPTWNKVVWAWFPTYWPLFQWCRNEVDMIYSDLCMEVVNTYGYLWNRCWGHTFITFHHFVQHATGASIDTHHGYESQTSTHQINMLIFLFYTKDEERCVSVHSNSTDIHMTELNIWDFTHLWSPKPLVCTPKLRSLENFGVYQFQKPSKGCVTWDINNHMY